MTLLHRILLLSATCSLTSETRVSVLCLGRQTDCSPTVPYCASMFCSTYNKTQDLRGFEGKEEARSGTICYGDNMLTRMNRSSLMREEQGFQRENDSSRSADDHTGQDGPRVPPAQSVFVRAQSVFVRVLAPVCLLCLKQLTVTILSDYLSVLKVRSNDEIQAMSWDQRMGIKMKACGRKLCCQEFEYRHASRSTAEGHDNISRQYRLESSAKSKRTSILAACSSCFCGTAAGSGSNGIGMNHNQRLASSLHWMFRVNFIFLFAVMCTIFFLWVMIFAGFIVGAGRLDDECIRVGGAPFADASSDFADAFALSWTTFSTVGYGSTYPALGHENSNQFNCLLITLICSLESFLGVLYSGFCGAILFGKVLRIQSHAQVLFSDPIVIRYGDGVKYIHREDSDDSEEEGLKRIPCPTLEFRVVNRLFGEVGGEIMDATLNVVANVDASDADPSLAQSFSSSGTGVEKASTMDSTSETHSESGGLSQSLDNRLSSRLFSSSGGLSSILHRSHHAVDEDPSARLVNKRIFSKMMIEASDHPFFKRVWLGRHILDDTSPILKPKVRRQIRRNQGYWPERLNSYEGVRSSLQFNQILVSLNGVSNVSASDVYAQKIYDFVDINVGYQFVNILYKDTDGMLKVDTDLINDVREQHGGGGEPLILGS